MVTNIKVIKSVRGRQGKKLMVFFLINKTLCVVICCFHCAVIFTFFSLLAVQENYFRQQPRQIFWDKSQSQNFFLIVAIEERGGRVLKYLIKPVSVWVLF